MTFSFRSPPWASSLGKAQVLAGKAWECYRRRMSFAFPCRRSEKVGRWIGENLFCCRERKQIKAGQNSIPHIRAWPRDCYRHGTSCHIMTHWYSLGAFLDKTFCQKTFLGFCRRVDVNCCTFFIRERNSSHMRISQGAIQGNSDKLQISCR